jgi:hypothetical protein
MLAYLGHTAIQVTGRVNMQRVQNETGQPRTAGGREPRSVTYVALKTIGLRPQGPPENVAKTTGRQTHPK